MKRYLHIDDKSLKRAASTELGFVTYKNVFKDVITVNINREYWAKRKRHTVAADIKAYIAVVNKTKLCYVISRFCLNSIIRNLANDTFRIDNKIIRLCNPISIWLMGHEYYLLESDDEFLTQLFNTTTEGLDDNVMF